MTDQERRAQARPAKRAIVYVIETSAPAGTLWHPVDVYLFHHAAIPALEEWRERNPDDFYRLRKYTP